jgi:tRNA threonylcarbamoyladenosine biosynthesis protein TsaB
VIVLGFDTATPATAIGLGLADGSIVQARDDPRSGERPGHATRLLPLAARLLADAGLRFRDLDRIAVGVGPGTFTGLRIGVASARGLAQSLGVELVGVSSLRALAVAVTRSGLDASAERSADPSDDGALGVLAVLDARRGEVFAAAYAPASGSVTGGSDAAGESGAAGGLGTDRATPTPTSEMPVPRELAAPRALAPANLGDVLEDVAATGARVARWVAVGNGAILCREELQALGMQVPPDDSALHRVGGEAICEIAVSSTAEALDTVLPDYRRRPDAEIALEGAGASGGGRG